MLPGLCGLMRGTHQSWWFALAVQAARVVNSRCNLVGLTDWQHQELVHVRFDLRSIVQALTHSLIYRALHRTLISSGWAP